MLSLLFGLFTVCCCAESVETTLPLLQLVYRCCTTEQFIIKFLPLLTTESSCTCRKSVLAVILSQLASSVTSASVGLLVSREEEEGNNEWCFLSKSDWAEKFRNILHNIWMQSSELPMQSEKCVSRNRPLQCCTFRAYLVHSIVIIRS